MPAFASQLAADRPDEAALTDPSGSLRWAEVGDALNRVANALDALDLGPQRRVAVFAENASETALAHLGGLLAGASTVPVNFHLTADETAYILRDSESRVLFVGPETLERGLAAARARSPSTAADSLSANSSSCRRRAPIIWSMRPTRSSRKSAIRRCSLMSGRDRRSDKNSSFDRYC